MVMCDIVMCDMSNMTICEMVEMSALFILDGIRKTADYKLISISYSYYISRKIRSSTNISLSLSSKQFALSLDWDKYSEIPKLEALLLSALFNLNMHYSILHS